MTIAQSLVDFSGALGLVGMRQMRPQAAKQALQLLGFSAGLLPIWSWILGGNDGRASAAGVGVYLEGGSPGTVASLSLVLRRMAISSSPLGSWLFGVLNDFKDSILTWS